MLFRDGPQGCPPLGNQLVGAQSGEHRIKPLHGAVGEVPQLRTPSGRCARKGWHTKLGDQCG
jgi:hypothetical protein